MHIRHAYREDGEFGNSFGGHGALTGVSLARELLGN